MLRGADEIGRWSRHPPIRRATRSAAPTRSTQPGRIAAGRAQVCPDVDERYALASNVFTGVAARIDLDDEKLVQTADTGMAAPTRSLAGIAVFK